jgi:lipoprotein-anchoring transpeptidase ErfK/SrfK
MFKIITVALLAGSWVFGIATGQAFAFDANQPVRVTPMRTAYVERSNRGGGLLEFLFGGPQSQGRYYQQQPMYEPQPAYGPRYPILPQMDPQQALQTEQDPAQRPFEPQFAKQVVEYHGRESPGTIVIDTPNKFLFLVQPNGQALRYGIGVGRPGFTWSGVKTISAKKEWPDWTPPADMLVRRPDLPRHMEGGPENPLGARAMYLGSSLYRIHGSNEPWTIGTNVSSGCIRMRNEDVIDLYGRVNVGAKVIVI